MSKRKYTITKEQILKFDRKSSREEELDKNGGWCAVHKVHKSDKTYRRTKKHSKRDDELGS
jgi:hypothetical protein